MTSRGATNARWGLALILLAGGSVGAVASCTDKTSGAPDASASAGAVASASATPSGKPEQEGANDDLRPVYPIDNLPPLPLAARYCGAVREAPARRREACCPSMGAVPETGECVRTLSAALRSGAVTLDAAEVDACVAAVAKETAGCDWVTSVGSPTVAACLGLIKGTLKEGARCRSNLECEEGARCRALGATRQGKCSPPLPARRVCNISTDSLAAFTGQDDLDRRHPECAGYCVRKLCADAVAVGARCVGSFECGPKAHCVAGKCAEGPLPGPGQACTDACAAGAHCAKGKCATAKTEGESCEEDAECRAHCERGDGGKAGQCARQCPSFLVPPVKPPVKPSAK